MLADSPAWAAVYGVAGVHNRCFRGSSPLTGKISGAHLRSAEHLALQGALDHPGPPSTDQADTDESYPDQQYHERPPSPHYPFEKRHGY